MSDSFAPTTRARIDCDRGIFVPPDREAIPWLPPKAEDVKRACEGDQDDRLWADLRIWLKTAAELPAEYYYDLEAAWILHTHIVHKFEFTPYLIMTTRLGERGKSRNGRAVIFASRRGIHTETLRPAVLFRWADRFEPAVFFDVCDLTKRIKDDPEAEDLLLTRFQRGLRVSRVTRPDAPAFRDMEYFKNFGPTVIATNREIPSLIRSRGIEIPMPESARQFPEAITEEAASGLRARAVAFGIRHNAEVPPNVEGVGRGRFNDITMPLLQIAAMAAPDQVPRVRSALEEIAAGARAREVQEDDGEVVRILAHPQTQWILVTFTEGARRCQLPALQVGTVAERLNDGREDKDKVTSRRIGVILRGLGFTTRKQGKYCYAIENKTLLTNLARRYDLQAEADR